MTTFRIVHFVPDPFVGGRMPVAALVKDSLRLQVVRVPHLPGALCLGGRANASAVRYILQDLEAATSFERLPAGVGPQCQLGPPQEIPYGVDDAAKWVTAMLLRVYGATERRQRHFAEERRTTSGYRFFRTYGVDRYVRKTFEPAHQMARTAGARSLHPISHYVQGANELLLLEPVIPVRRGWLGDVREIAERFGAYKTALRADPAQPRARFCAYVLAGATAQRWAEIEERLRPFADATVETQSERNRQEFLSEIRRIGDSALPLD